MSYFTYILAGQYMGTLYTGVTNDLQRRVTEHKSGCGGVFSSKYKVGKLVWFEVFATPGDAIRAEKTIKGWKRERKISLIEKRNPDWLDLISTLSV
jgi:putative endonuclease